MRFQQGRQEDAGFAQAHPGPGQGLAVCLAEGADLGGDAGARQDAEGFDELIGDSPGRTREAAVKRAIGQTQQRRQLPPDVTGQPGGQAAAQAFALGTVQQVAGRSG